MSKPTILCLSGWAQNPESLQVIFDDFSKQYKIVNFNYSQFSSIKECFLAFKNLKISPQIIVGWSLGGQIAARLIAKKIFNPELLILIAAPFEFVKSKQISAAMPKTSFDSFYNNFVSNSSQTLEKFSLLMVIGDAKRTKLLNAEELEKNLKIDEKNYPGLVFWLEELGRFSCSDLDFTNFPPALILHGQGDMVVNVEQAKTFAKKIKNAQLEIIPNCGHCPHISHLQEVRRVLSSKL